MAECSKPCEEFFYSNDYKVVDDFEDNIDLIRKSRSRSRSKENRLVSLKNNEIVNQNSACSSSHFRSQSTKSVIRARTPSPILKQIVERAPTPEPDVHERIIIRPQAQYIYEKIIERPRTPPPRIVNREILEPAPAPIYRTKIVTVEHSPRHYERYDHYSQFDYNSRAKNKVYFDDGHADGYHSSSNYMQRNIHSKPIVPADVLIPSRYINENRSYSNKSFEREVLRDEEYYDRNHMRDQYNEAANRKFSHANNPAELKPNEKLENGKAKNSKYFDVIPKTVLQKFSKSTPDVNNLNPDAITGVLINDNRNMHSPKFEPESILKDKSSPKTSPNVEKKLLFKEA